MSTRSSTQRSNSAAGNLSRRTTRTLNLDPQGGTLRTATTIAFNAPNTITDSGNGLGAFRVGQRIEVRGSPANARVFVVATVAAGALTLAPAVVTGEAAGARITINTVE